MNRQLLGFLFVICLGAVYARTSHPDIREACRQLEESVRPMRRLAMPNVYNPATWYTHIDSFLDKACTRVTALEQTMAEVGSICTFDSYLKREASFLINNTRLVCTEEKREVARNMQNNECVSDDDRRYDLGTQALGCFEDHYLVSHVASHAGREAYCLVYHTFMECVQRATAAACGPEVAWFVPRLWNIEENHDCYIYSNLF